MFSLLKKKLKSIAKSIKEKVSLKKVKKEAKKREEKVEKKKTKKEKVEKKEERKIRIDEKKFEEIFEDIEIELLESNVALEVIEKIKEELKELLVKKGVKKIEKEIEGCLKEVISNILLEEDFDKLIEKIKEKPIVILFLGVNGSGKTTTIGKIAKYLLDKGYSVVLSASDTFRAASIEQIEKIGKILNVKVIKHQYGSDPAAVAYDAISYARSKGINFVLIDTAGRLHTNTNLMEELKKIKRVTKPAITIFVADSLTGNDAIEQARTFNEEIGFDYVILSKADVDKKGGIAISIGYVTKKPIIFLGTGQSFDDLEKFSKEKIIKKIFED